MKHFLQIIIVFLITSCNINNIKSNQKLELILLGVPENADNTHEINYGSQKYFLFENSDSIVVKECTYLDEKTGEPIYPVSCEYYSKSNNEEEKTQINNLFKYFNSQRQGSISEINKDEINCDLFGAWLAIYTNEKSERKYFIFNCDGIPSQLRNFCSKLNNKSYDLTTITTLNTNINTDSIVLKSYIELEDIFVKIDSMKSRVKFTERPICR